MEEVAAMISSAMNLLVEEAATMKLFAMEIASATKPIAVKSTQASDREHEWGRLTPFMT